MVRTPVESSDVASIGYDAENMTMEVTFHKSGTYLYYNVPPQIYATFLQAPSKGKYANLVLKHGPYPYDKVG